MCNYSQLLLNLGRLPSQYPHKISQLFTYGRSIARLPKEPSPSIENTHLGTKTCGVRSSHIVPITILHITETTQHRLSRGRDCWIFPWIMDPPLHHFDRPSVIYFLEGAHQTRTLTGAASFTIYSGTKELLHDNKLLADPTLLHVAGTGAVSGAASGALVCFGSCRESLLYLPTEFILITFQHSNLSKYAILFVYCYFISWNTLDSASA